jgi:alpha-galactosidase
LLHTGDVVRADHPDAGAWLHGVVSADRREAVFGYVRLATSPDATPGRLRLPGLDPALDYEVVRRDEAGTAVGIYARPVPWWSRGRTVASGGVLGRIGLPAPLLNPEEAVLLHVQAHR